MLREEFTATRFLGKGVSSFVYEVTSKRQEDKGAKYAIKRLYLRNPDAIQHILCERRFLEQLNETPSPLFPAMYYARKLPKSVALVMEMGSGLDLYNLRQIIGPFPEDVARFYVAELLCALEHLHSLGIVHRDIKLENILLSRTGHVLVTDFDLACRLEEAANFDPRQICAGTLCHMPPEVASGAVVTTKADVWCLGALIADLVSKPIRSFDCPNDEAFIKTLEGRWDREVLVKCSPTLTEVITSCLEVDYLKRPKVSHLKNFKWFDNVNWEESANAAGDPPYRLESYNYSNAWVNHNVREDNPLLLEAFYGEEMPYVDHQMHTLSERDGTVRLLILPRDEKALLDAGLTDEKLDELFADYDYTHDSLLAEESCCTPH